MASETMTREDIYREFAKGEDADGLYHVQMDEMADEIIRLRATLAQRREGVSACAWRFMDWPASDSDFETECGQAWSFNDGGITENGVVFCHHCGGKVIAPEIPKSCEDCGGEISPDADVCEQCQCERDKEAAALAASNEGA